MKPSTGPLAGIRIVEFDAIGPVPLAGMMFADMGADVVRIARPKTGSEVWEDVGGSILHRGRTTVEIDLKTQRETALALVTHADALLEGMRPGVMERLGLGPEPCLSANPRLVYGRVTGWGQTGPLARRAGHDLNFVGLTGVLHAIGAAAAPPAAPLNLIGDYGGGAMFLVTGVLATLLNVRATGRGQVVDAAMTDSVVLLSSLFQAFLATGRWSMQREANLLDGGAPFYRCYVCADGRYIAVGALEPSFFQLFLTGLDIAPDAYEQNDREQWPRMIEEFSAVIASKPRDHWSAVFSEVDACVTPVLDWHEARAHPHNAARGTFEVMNGIYQPAPAPRFSKTPSAIREADISDIVSILDRWTTHPGDTSMESQGNKK